MATTESSAPTNGTYAQGYDNYAASQQQSASQPAQQAPASEIPKDEVGWYFVEQYYTTLSKSPDRLYVCYAASAALHSKIQANAPPALLQQALAVCLRRRGGEGQRLRWPEGALRHSPMICHWRKTNDSPAHQRAHQGARVQGHQSPRHQRRLPGLRRQHRHPGHW